ncbi:MAG TPA: DUF488 domain-containing protein [Candidatus Bathyarchaeota archaeon]|nr:DUF488 domain-containing protein [Candidatus Bathyarchaeota archaeon]
MSHVVYTVGHSNRTLKEFIRILKAHGIQVVIDVRRFPTSRKVPHFSREALSEALREAGVEYVYLGDLLGGYRSGGYVRHMETEAYRQGVERVLELSRDRRVAVMCAEKFPWRCHRRHIARTLEEMGVPVVHIIDEEKTWTARRSRELLRSQKAEGRLPQSS